MAPNTPKRKDESEHDETPMSGEEPSQRAPSDDDQTDDEIRVPQSVPPRKNPREASD